MHNISVGVKKSLTIFLSIVLICQLFNFGLFFNPQTAKATVQNWDFSDSGDYTLSDETKIEILGEQAQLKGDASWYDADYKYRKEITITNNSGSEMTDHQVNILLTESNFNFDRTRTNGTDVSFADADKNAIDYWLEYFKVVTASFWVKVSIAASGTKDFYIYYGRSDYVETDYFEFTADSTAHTDYGLTYPVTYKFSIPPSATDLTAYKRYDTSQEWSQLNKKTSADYFNGIEAVRFEYDSDAAYVSAAFGPDTDKLQLKFTDSTGLLAPAGYLGTTKYYDNREAAVVFSGDDFASGYDRWMVAMDMFNTKKIWLSAGIITRDITPDQWSSFQTKIGANKYIEPVSHSVTHNYNNLNIPPATPETIDTEVKDSRDAIKANLTLPYSKGTDEYVWGWTSPGARTNSTIRSKLGTYKYLSDVSGTDYQPPSTQPTGNEEYTDWDETNELYGNWNRYSFIKDGGAGKEIADLKTHFDDIVDEQQIFHLGFHPWNFNLEDFTIGSKSKIDEITDYVKDKTNLWYTGTGLLYLYHYTEDIITTPSFLVDNTTLSDYDNTFTKDYFASGEGNQLLKLHMDEGTGSSTADTSGNNLNGTIGNEVAWVGSDGGQWADRDDVVFSSGNCLEFNGDNVGNDPNKYMSTSGFTLGLRGITLSAWVNVSSRGNLFFDNSTAVIFHYSSSGFYLTAGGQVSGYLNWDATPSLNEWVHITATWQDPDFGGSGLMKLYVNGQAQSSTLAFNPTNALSNSAEFYIGREFNTWNPGINGSIDEVQIYGRELSADEIMAHYKRSKYVSPAPSDEIEVAVDNDYDTGFPSATLKSSQAQAFTSLSGFSADETTNGGTITYQISNDAGTTWYWWNGSAWAETSAGVSQSNSESTINSHIATFSPGGGDFVFRAYLNSDGAQLVQLDSVSLTYENDVTLPIISISSPSNNSSTSYKIVTITGSATDSGSGISSLTINGVPISNPANFSETVQLGSGLNTFTFVATDNTGNSTTETLNITKLEPSITVTYPPNDVFLLLTRDWYIKITGSVNGNEVGIKSFRINGRTISNPGNFSMYVPVYKHWNTYTLVATDNADNTVEKIVKVYSTQGPPRPGFPPLLFTNIHSRLTKSYNNVFKVLSFGETSTISLDQSFTADRRPKFSGQTAPGAIIDIEIHSDPIKATIIADDVGNWEYQVEEDLELGSHTMQIIIKSPENETIFEGNYNFIVENAKAASKSDGIQETQSASSMILIVLLSIALFGLIVIYFENKNRHKPLY